MSSRSNAVASTSRRKSSIFEISEDGSTVDGSVVESVLPSVGVLVAVGPDYGDGFDVVSVIVDRVNDGLGFRHPYILWYTPHRYKIMVSVPSAENCPKP